MQIVGAVGLVGYLSFKNGIAQAKAAAEVANQAKNSFLAVFALRVEDKGLQIRLEWQPNIPQYVQTDSLKLRQVLINLQFDKIASLTEVGAHD
jgi:C4-dicarboxylate-specific signal transduction histidine kinase